MVPRATRIDQALELTTGRNTSGVGFAVPTRLPILLACSILPASACGSATNSPADTNDDAGSSDSDESTGDSESTDTDSTGTDSTDESESEGGLTRCPMVEAPVARATVSAPDIGEASGLVHSRTQDLLWVHNDSGDGARLFALGLDGQTLATVELDGAAALDWEDLALGPGPSPGEWLYAGDIGDNGQARPWITVYRLREPDVAAAGSEPIVLADWEALDLTYPDGPHDAEALLVDPVEGDLFIVSKDAETRLFRLAAPLASGQLEELAEPNFPSALATAADVSPLGDFVVVRGYVDAFAWLRGADQTLAEAMLGEPCELPLANEQQGETIAVAADGVGYYTLSEGADQPLWWFAFAE